MLFVISVGKVLQKHTDLEIQKKQLFLEVQRNTKQDVQSVLKNK
jgi:hypothetical protein